MSDQRKPRIMTPEDLPFWRHIQWSMILFVLAAVMVPIGIVLSVMLVRTAEQSRQQAINQLESVADLKVSQVEEWLNTGAEMLDVYISSVSRITQFTQLVDNPVQGAFAVNGDLSQTQKTFQDQNGTPLFDTLFFYDVNGKVLASSDTADVGLDVTNQPYFANSQSAATIHPPYFETGSNELVLIVSRPISGSGGQHLGVLAGKLDLNVLSGIMLQRSGLGETGHTYLVSHENNYLLTATRFGEEYPLTQAYQSTGIERGLSGQDGQDLYDDFRGSPVIGAYRSVPSLGAVLIAEIEQREALQATRRARNTSIAIGLVSAVLAVAAGIYIVGQFTVPVSDLTTVAVDIAGGNLSRRAQVHARNEVGVLAYAFNTMANGMQDLIGTLEERVDARTRDLQLAAEVSQQVATVLDLQDLMPRVVSLTRQNFNLYHAQVYLLNEDGDRLELEAGTGEAGSQMKQAGHNILLAAERSLVARAGRDREPIVVNDVAQQPDHLPNPLLPETRAEVALPMVVGERLIGVLDVQSNELDRFDADIIPVLRTLVGQIAVAVQNARAFNEIQAAQAETRRALDELARRDRFLTGITDVATLLLNRGIDALNEVLAKLGFTAQVSRVHLFEHFTDDDGDDALRQTHLWTGDGVDGDVDEPELQNVSFRQHLPGWLEALRRGDPVTGIVDEMTGPMHTFFAARDVQSVLALPLFVEGDLYGVISLDDSHKRIWSQQEIDILRTASTSISYALVGNRLLERTQEALLQVETLYGVSQRFVGAQTTDDIILAFMEVNPLMSGSTARLYFIENDPGGQPEVIWLAASSEAETVPGDRQRFESFAYADQLLSDPHNVHLLGEGAHVTGVAIPLVPSGRNWIGALVAEWPKPRRVADNEQQLYNVLGLQMATVASNVRLYEQTRQSEQLTRSVIDASNDWIWAKDDQFRFILVNRALAEQAYGEHPRAMIGKTDYDYFPKELVDGDPEREIVGFRVDDEKALSGQVVHNPYDVVRHTDGSEHILDTVKMPLRDIDGTIIGTLGMGRDMTGLQHARERQQAAYTLGQQLNRLLDPAELLQATIANLAETFNYYHAHIYLLDEAGKKLTVAEGLGEAGKTLKLAGHSIALTTERSLVAQASRLRQPVVVSDVTKNPDHLPNPLLPLTKSEVAVPLVAGDELLGVLDVQQSRVDAFDEDEVQLLETVTSQLAVALNNARLVESLQESNTAMREMEQAVTNSPEAIFLTDREGVFTYINAAFTDIYGFTADELVGKQTPRVIKSGLLPQDRYAGFWSSLLSKEVVAGEIVNKSKDGRILNIQGSNTALTDENGEIIGFVGIHTDITERVEVRNRRQSAYVLGQQLNQLLDPTELLQATIDNLVQTFDYYHAHIYLLDEEEDRLVVKEGLGEAGQMLKEAGHSIPLAASRSLVARAGRSLEAVVVSNVADSPDHLPNPLLPETRSEAAVPLIVGHRLMGVLDVQQNKVDAFSEDELQILSIVANQLAVSLSNAQLFAETQNVLAETEMLYAGSDRIVRAQSYDDVLNALVEMSTLHRYDRAGIYLFDKLWSEQPETMIVQASLDTRKGENLAPVGTQYPMAAFPILKILEPGQPVIITDIETDERADDNTRDLFLNQLKMRSLVALPLEAAGEFFGLVMGQTAEATEMLPEELRQISALTDQAAAVVRSIRLYDETVRSQRLLRQVLDTVPDWLFVKDTAYRFIMANEAFADFFGERTPDDLIGKDDYDLGTPAELIEGDPERGIEGFRAADNRVLVDGETTRVDHDVVMFTDGTEHILDTQKMPITDNDGSIVAMLGYSRDITEDIRARRREQLAQDIGRQLTTLLDPDELVTETVETLAAAFDYYHAHIYLLDEATGRLVVAGGLGEAGKVLKEAGHNISLQAERSLVARAGRSLEPVVVNDVTANPDHLPNPLLPETRSEVAVPLAVGERLLGVLDVQHNRPNAFNEGEVGMLSTVANQLSIALSNAELYQQQLETADKLREVDQLKNEFLANMSHELRTPLNSIIGYSELLIDEVAQDLDEMSREDLEAIHSSGQHLLAIINDILDLAKIEAGRMELTKSTIVPSEFVAQVVEAAGGLLRDKPNLKLKVDVNKSLPTVEADAIRLRQVLWNLLSNAIKFTDKGTVKLSVVQQDSMLRFTVEDTGIGIAPEAHELVFDQFRQADGSTTRRAGGTGLGLTITRQLVQMHGGELWLESEVGKGSTFTFTLPLPEEESVPAATTGNGHKKTASKGAVEAASAD